MKQWPRTIPFDLKKMLGRLREYRSPPSEQDDWGAIFECLNHRGVEQPDHALQMEPELLGPGGHT